MITVARPGPAAWLRARSGRHTVATLVIAPGLFWIYSSAAGPTISGDPAWAVLLGLTAVIGAATVATYLPRRVTADASLGSPCATLAGAHVLLAAVMLSTGPHVPMRGVLAFGMVLLALIQRLNGTASCSIR